jgi:hypothetical protein
MLAMIAAQKKLREARFFHDLLVSTEQQIMKQHGEEASDFYLSAFLSATRSVVSVFEDNDEKKRFNPWYKQWKRKLKPAERSVVIFHIGQRGKSVHGYGAETVMGSTSIPIHELQMELATRGGAAYFWRVPGTEAPTTARASLNFRNRSATDVATSSNEGRLW